MPDAKDKEKYCFIFELLIKDMPIIVDIVEDNLVLLSVRNIKTYKELPHEPFAQQYNWNYAKEI